MYPAGELYRVLSETLKPHIKLREGVLGIILLSVQSLSFAVEFSNVFYAMLLFQQK